MEPVDIRDAREGAYENPRPELAALVPAESRRILDLGCASGAFGATLKARQGAEVVGVELDPDYARDAADRLDRVVQADVEELAARPDLAEELGGFDCLIAGDVLEHLRDPWTALARYASLLDAAGTAVVSLPNVRYWDTFYRLGIRGRWPRNESGIFDATHLRWFTLADAYDLMHGAGLEVLELRRVMRLRPHDDSGARLARALERTKLRPFFTFQYLLRARRS